MKLSLPCRLFPVVLAGSSACVAQAVNDWSMYGHDGGSTRNSPLTDINPKNVAGLKLAWTYHMAPPASVTPVRAGSLTARLRQRRSEATPIMVGGMLYMPTPYSTVVALDPATGKQVWEYKLPEGTNASTRGVSYWPGDRSSSARIVFGTTDGFLMALDAATGHASNDFGEGGRVNMKPGVSNGFDKASFTISSPPQVYRNVLITGSQVQEFPSQGVSGDVRGWDALTGKLLWQFHTVPHPGEAGNETWETPDSWKNRSGANAWGLMTLDPDSGTVYLPLGSPATDAWGGDRKGNNLYGNSLVVLDAVTGKLRWAFQAIHHDTWDYDLESAPVLVSVRRGTRAIPAVVITSKTGLVFILDRRDGKPIYPVKETSVPHSDVPGEISVDTQPVPVKPAPLARMTFSPEDVAKVTPEHQKFCEELMKTDGGTHNDGPFTRYGLKESIVFPGTLGATNWHGGSYDPRLHYVFFNTIQLADVGKVKPTNEGSPVPYRRSGPVEGYARFWNPDTFWPCQRPPWGEMVALNVDTGEYAWRVPLGTIPELDAKGVHNTGSMNMGGSITTASGLLFISATTDHHFRAFDTKTGKVVWDTLLDTGAYTTPMTYKAPDGKQYVVIVATGGGYYDRGGGDSVFAFALPEGKSPRVDFK